MKTHFGFQTIDQEEKQQRVRGVFDAVASRYDLMNDLMSGGLHRLWKREMVASLAPRAGQHILDVAGGTGDIAFRILRTIENQRQEARGKGQDDSAPACITVCDINEAMLSEGRNRAIDKNLLPLPSTEYRVPSTLHWINGNAESLPFPDHHFDAYTIAFGIRNVTHIEKALAEAYRVLKIGGRFLCLEFAHVQDDLLAKLYDTYSFRVIPWLGERITHDRAAYQYLVESIRKFPTQEKFVSLIRQAGFSNVTCRNMTGGVVALHSGRKL